MDSNLAIRPVINLNKCVIEDGCYDEQVGDNCSITTEDEIDPPVKSTVVKIENTLKNNSYILIILGLLLITGGYIVYKYKFKKKNN